MPHKTYNIALIGYGYWGPVLLRNFAANDRFRVKYVCDHHLEKTKKVRTQIPGCHFVVDSAIPFADPTVDVIAIATEAGTHATLARQALHHNKHLFIEKPFTVDVKEAEDLCHLAHARQRALWVDHTFLFTPAFALLKQQVTTGKIGKLQHFQSTRTTPGPFHKDANVIWNLAYHDAYLLQELLPQDPLTVSAKANAYVHGNVASAATIALTYKDDIRADLTVSMNHPEKQRAVVVSGSTGSFLWDETSVDKLIYRPIGASPVPMAVPVQEALALEVSAFACYLDDREPGPADAAKALQTMRLTAMMVAALIT